MTDDSLCFDQKLELRSWGLPDYILEKYLKRGVTKMFPWQVECLMSENVLLGGNLIYSAPTSAGKTLVSEILALKTVLERKKKVIVILPFVSVVREKMIYFQEVLAGSGIKVDGFMGSYNPPGGFKNVQLAICTIEKANNIINRLLEDKNFDEIGCVVVDELHLLGDPHRGYLLELLLTKLKYVCQKGLAQSIQVVGMSATLPNLDLLASWLNAALYRTQFRPIPLFEYLKVGRTIYKSPELTESSELQPVCEIPNDPGDVVSLCLDTIIQGFSVLVFCPAKNWCETLAVQIAAEIKRLGNEKDKMAQDLRSQLNSRGIYEILEQLKKCPAGLERNLFKSVSFGVAYHHAGLTLDERDIIEGGFRQNVIRVLVATSTLSSGVNLPARRVIIRSPAFQGHCMDILTYRQMIGRAGRMGKDTAGESYLICTEKDVNWGKKLVSSELPPVASCLGSGDLSSSLKRALLEVIAGGVVRSRSEVLEYVMCTLLAAGASDIGTISSAVEQCTEYLARHEFIKVEEAGDLVLPSSLGSACLSSSVPPEQALHLLQELSRARQCFVLDSDLHAIYQVTPYSICDSWNVDWMKVFAIWEELPPNMQKIGDLVGVEDRFLIRAMRGTINLNADEYSRKISVHKRFYTCLALQDLINETPLNTVADKYGCTKGMLQSLQQSASTFAAMVTSFCRKLGWSGLEVLLSELAARIQFGVQKELLDLLRLDCMTSVMARALFNAEITTLSELASTPPQALQLALSKARPFKSENIEGGVVESVGAEKNTYLPGRPGLTEKEAANILIFEARRYILKEMGVKTAEWEDSRIDLVNDSIYERTTITQDDVTGPGNTGESRQLNENQQPQEICNKSEQVDMNCSINKVRPRKSSPVEFNSKISAEHKININDNDVPDTQIIEQNDLDSLNIQEIENPKEIAPVPYYKSQSKNEPDLFESSEIKLEDCEEGKVGRVNASDSLSFPIFVRNAKLCSTYLIEGKDPTLDKLSMEPMCGSPEVDQTDLDFMDSVLGRIVAGGPSYSTPVAKENLTNNSANDLFSDSIHDQTPDRARLSSKQQNLEELDSNWGGDSLLELSQHFENLIKTPQTPKTPAVKRKAPESSENMPSHKKICANPARNKPVEGKIKTNPEPVLSSMIITPKEEVNDLNFGDTLIEFDTQIENILNTTVTNDISNSLKFSKPKPRPLTQATSSSKSHLKLLSRPKSDGDLMSSTKVGLGDSVLAKAFDGTFACSQLILEVDTLAADDLHISDSEEDLIKGSPDILHKSKFDLTSSNKTQKTLSARSLGAIYNISPNKQHRFSRRPSPKSSPRNMSPSKYPPIGLDIIKHLKSPSRKKSLPFTSKTSGNSPQRRLNNIKNLPSNTLATSSSSSESSSHNSPPKSNCSPQKSSNSSQKKTNSSQKSNNSPRKSNNSSQKNNNSPQKNNNSPQKSNSSPLDLVLSLQPSKESSSTQHKSSNKSCVVLSEKTPDNSPELVKSTTKTQITQQLSSLNKNLQDTCDIISDSGMIAKKSIENGRGEPSIEASIPQNNSTQKTKLSELLLPLADKILNAQPFENSTNHNNNIAKREILNDDFTKSSFPTQKNNGLRILDVVALGENGNHIEALHKMKEFVFTLKTKKVKEKETQRNEIGGRMVRRMTANDGSASGGGEPQFKVDDEALVGVYLYGGTGVLYYFNMITLGTAHYRLLKGLLIQKSIKLFGFNMNSQLKMFYKSCGYIISCRIYDLAVADWLLNPEDNTKTLQELGAEYLKPGSRSPSKSESSSDPRAELSLLWALRAQLFLRLQKANLLKHFEEIEMPIQCLVLLMELTGIGFQHSLATEMWTSSTELMGRLEMEIYSMANRKFSLLSNTDLNKVKKELKIGGEEETEHPLLVKVHNWRKLHSLKTRNLSQLLLRKEARCQSRSSTRTATGRIVMLEPDLQHIPRDFTVDDELFSLRSAFIASPGNILVSADYSQLELRILAHFSRDPILVPLLRKGDDVFKNIAAEWNGTTLDKVTDELRHQAKQMTYGIIYGMGDKALGEALGKSGAEAGLLSARFKRSFPKLEDFIRSAIEECRQTGQVKTLAGRVRHLPAITSSNPHLRAQAERQAVNSKIQGSASDIAKKAMIEIENNLNRKFPGRSSLPSSLNTSHLVLQLHDEFIYEVEEGLVSSFIPLLRETMETATFLSVPLPVVVKSGRTWGLLSPV